MAFRHFDLRAPRALRLAGSLAATLLLLSCGDDPVGSGQPGFGSLSLRFEYGASVRFVPITLDRVQVVVEQVLTDSTFDGEITDTLVNTTRNFGVTAEELRLSIPVPLASSQQNVRVTLRLLSGATELFVGSSDVDLSVGQTTTSETIPVTYVGPGANAVGLIIEPFDTTVTAGSTTPFRATAINGQEQDVGAFYMRWSLSSTANGASIDAAGRFKAPSQAGSLWVRGNLPNGVDDSVQVTVTGAPSSMAIASGDGQSGSPGITLEIPLSVFVSGSGGAPVQGVPVTWAATVGGGGVETGSTVTGADGIASTRAILGPNPGLNRYTASSPGLTTVTFSANLDQTGGVVVWSGATNSAWSDSENWTGGKVPGVLDSVVIGDAEFYPVLDTTPIVSAMTLQGNASLTINSHGLAIVRGLSVTGNAYLVMTDQSDAISVGGNVLFDGGSSVGHLTGGGLSIAGNFTQRATTSGASFVSSGGHVMVLAGSNTTVTFATPGLGANQSHFNDVAWAGQGTLTLASNVFAGVMTASFQGTGTTITSTAGRELRATQFLTPGQSRLTFNNVTLNLTDTTNATAFLSLITFQNMPTNRAQLTLSYPGGIADLNSFIFSTTPVAPNGFYINATDTQVGDGSSLTVRVQNPTPSSMGTFFNEGGDAEIIWPYISTP